MQYEDASLAYGEVAIAERDWLIVGFMWMALGAAALGQFDGVAKAGRILFAFAFMVHTIGAMYAAFRAWSVGLSARIWLLRTLVLGSLALVALEKHLKKESRVKRIR